MKLKKIKQLDIKEWIILVLFLLLTVSIGYTITNDIEHTSQTVSASAENDKLSTQVSFIEVELNVAQQAIIAYREDVSFLSNQKVELTEQILIMKAELDQITNELIEYKKLKIDPTDITVRSNISEDQLSAILKGTGLEGLEKAYIEAERTYDINAIYLVSITALESAWGTSRLAMDKNNISGFQAYDKNPYEDAFNFSSKEECILTTARVLSEKYVDQGLISIKEINSKYASDTEWSNKVSWIGETIYNEIR